MEDDFKKLSLTMANVMVNFIDKSNSSNNNGDYATTFNAVDNANNLDKWGSLKRCR